MSRSAEETMAVKTDRLSFGRKLGYGLGGSASNFIWQMVSLYMLYFYTDVFGISAAVAGTIFLGARIFDAANDPIMGYLADQTRSRWGKFRPYILFGTVPLAITFILTFSTPALSATGKVIYAAVTYVLLGVAYTVVNIPYNAMAAVITQNTNERSSVSAIMLITTYIAVLIIAVATMPLVKAFPTEQLGFTVAVSIYALLSVALFFICFATTREKTELVKRQRHGLGHTLKLLFANKYLLILLSTVFFTSVANEMRSGAAIYFFKYNVGNQDLYPMFMLVIILSMIVGALLTPMLGRKLGSKRNLFIIATVLTMAAGAGILLVSYKSLPEMTITPETLPALYVLSALGSIGGGINFVLAWSMIADTVEYGEWKTGVRGEGIIYSTMTFTTKLAYAVGGALSGLLLGMAGYVPNVVQTPAVQKVILYMLALFPVLAGLIAIGIMSFYKIDVRFYNRILKEIKERESGSGVEVQKVTASPGA